MKSVEDFEKCFITVSGQKGNSSDYIRPVRMFVLRNLFSASEERFFYILKYIRKRIV